MREMLACIDSPEIAEWMAFERAFGPIGHEWRDEMLASIHEQLQMLNFLYGAVNSEEDENPVPEPIRMPRPPDVRRVSTGEAEEEEEQRQKEELPVLPPDEYFM